ncbi:MAG: hypothetical protein IJ021_05870 [Clostridia bacterium]|nr:hypothetical protein [Clostridia bacterium]
MKKFLAIFLAVIFVFTMTTTLAFGASVPTDSKNNVIGSIDYLDFSEANNAWAERYEEDVLNDKGEVIHKKGDYVLERYYEDQFVNGAYPTAIFLDDKYSYEENLDYSFKNNGEVISISSIGTAAGALAFQTDPLGGTFKAGAEASGAIEYAKLRIKNNSACTKFSVGVFRTFGGNTGFDSRTVANIEMEPNMSGWTTITVSLRDLNFDQKGAYNWSSDIREILIFPFGYDKANEAYEGAEIEIDYIVFGSLEYVTGYESALEIKENSATEFNPVTAPEVTTYYTGDKLDLTGFTAEITFKDGVKETIDTASAIYNFEKPEGLGEEVDSWKTKVQLVYGKLIYEYEVTVVDVESVEFATPQYSSVYNKLDILIAGKFTPAGLTLKINFADGTSKVKALNQFALEGTDFTNIDVPLSAEGYYEYIVTANFYGNTITFPVNIIDVKDIELTPVTEKKNSIYYGTVIDDSFFTVTAVYTNGTKDVLEIPAEGEGVSIDEAKKARIDVLLKAFSVSCDTTSGQGGDTVATAKLVNPAYNINVAKDFNVMVQKPTSLEVKLNNANKVAVDSDITRSWFTVKYKYSDGEEAEINDNDPNLIINYDTSAPGENSGKVKIGDMSADFKYTVLDVKFDADTEALKAELENRGTVKLLAPKFPTFWLVTIIVVAVIAVLVAAYCVLKYVFKIDFKPKKKFNLDDIF